MPRPGWVEQRLRKLADRYSLADPALRQLHSLLRFVVDEPSAPTTLRDDSAVLKDHLADSLVGLELPEVVASRWIADLGSGAGFPGLVVGIALPSAHVTLVESNARKCAFIDRAIGACGLRNADVVHARVEEWDAGQRACDLVTARAIAPLDVVAEYAAPLLSVPGALVAWRGQRDAGAEAAARTAAAILGLEVGQVRSVVPYPGAEHRHLHVFSKVGSTPDRFPRRPGMARKRPLGAGAGIV